MAIIKVKIDVTKIDKARLFAGKNGAKYLDCTLIERRDGRDQYGNDFMITQDVSKEERLAGVKGAILGNAKYLEAKQGAQPQAKTPSPAAAQDDDSDSVPF